MKVDVHILSYRERDIIGWTLAHYSTFARRIVLHDAMSTDGTREIAATFQLVEVRDWHCPDEINDAIHRDLKNECWKGTDADWCITVDADELIHSPDRPMLELLSTYDALGIPVVVCTAFEMYAEEFPVYEPGRQIYDVVKDGAREARWYDKPAMFSPRRVSQIGYDAGAHHAFPVSLSGQSLPQPVKPTNPPCWLLHCKHLGPVERIQREYTTDQSRLSNENRRNGWGVVECPNALAVEKRAQIRAGLQRLFA